MTLDPKAAFLHLIYDYRYLAQAVGAWKLYGPSGNKKEQEIANTLIPGISITLLDSMLMHSRALIEFYTKPPTQRRSTDILLGDFDGTVIDTATATNLSNYKKPVEIHVLHLTAWRDVAQRTTHEGTAYARPNWNTEATKLARLLFDALDEAAQSADTLSNGWHGPLLELHKATIGLYNEIGFEWPKHLTEKLDVYSYLTSLDL